MKLKKILSIILIACLCMLSILSIAFSASAGMESELDLLKATMSRLNQRMDAVEALTEEHGTALEELQQDVELLKADIATIEAEIDTLNESVDSLGASAIQEINGKIVKLDENVKALEKSINEKIAALEAKDKELADKDATLEAKDKELADKNAELEKKIKELEDKITALESKVNETETEKTVESPTEKLEEKEIASTNNSGCGASIAISALVTICTMGAMIVIKKKENT